MSSSNGRPRLRDLGLGVGIIPPGRWNAITDVPGLKVGQVTLIRGKGKLRPGHGPVRCGVTAIVPAPGDLFASKLAAGVHIMNGYGKSVGLMQIAETGRLETPILLTGTLNVWRVADALIDWILERNPRIYSVSPTVLECSPHWADDVAGRHVGRREVFEALRRAKSGPVEEGNVGGGTGLSSFGLKSGIGTSSRKLPERGGGWTVGTLVQANAGSIQYLSVGGLPFGREMVRSGRALPTHTALTAEECRRGAANLEAPDAGSLICVVATDAPLSARQLTRLARRAALGLGRAGLASGHASGDIVLAVSTAERFRHVEKRGVISRREVPDARLADLFNAANESAEEAYLNAALRAETLEGVGGARREALPMDLLKRYLKERKL
ncbi:MAG TPA: P1 family peptidase [Planctomycetota bacterium]|nr:P1 family peptidase [Planctomycetota bacterium]